MINRFLYKIKALWKVLVSKNCIVIHNIKETDKGHTAGVTRVTSYTDERDMLIMASAVEICFGRLKVSVKEGAQKAFDKNGNYITF